MVQLCSWQSSSKKSRKSKKKTQTQRWPLPSTQQGVVFEKKHGGAGGRSLSQTAEHEGEGGAKTTKWHQSESIQKWVQNRWAVLHEVERSGASECSAVRPDDAFTSSRETSAPGRGGGGQSDPCCHSVNLQTHLKRHDEETRARTASGGQYGFHRSWSENTGTCWSSESARRNKMAVSRQTGSEHMSQNKTPIACLSRFDVTTAVLMWPHVPTVCTSGLLQLFYSSKKYSE